MICRRDGCGIVCVIFIYFAIIYAEYALVFWMILPTFKDNFWGPFHVLILNVLLALAVTSHARTMLSDPGIVPLEKRVGAKNRRSTGLLDGTDSDDSTSERELMVMRRDNRQKEDWTICTRCESFRPPRAHHCRICRRCIRRMDHHCPWVNNCVGEFNQKFFLQFLLYVATACLYSLLLIVLSWMYHDEHGETGAKGPNGPNVHHAKVLHTIFVSIESALFCMFVIAVSCDQMQGILSGETAIEAVQRRGRLPRKQRSTWSALVQVCGRGSLASWMLPCSESPRVPDLPNLMKENAQFTV